MTFAPLLFAFLLLAAGTWRQSAILLGRIPPAAIRRSLLGGGYAVLALSLARVLTGDDPSRGLVAWFGSLTLAALIVLLACWWRQRAR